MARMRYPRAGEPLPAPLPPETRTVGQLVAETIKRYGERFWATLLLGVPVAGVDLASFHHSWQAQIAIEWAFVPAFAAAFVWASAIATEAPLDRRRALTAFVVAMLVYLPFPVLVRLYLLPGFVYLAFFALAVPAALVEGSGVVASVARGFRLGRADFKHALGALVTLALVYLLTRSVLLFLLRSQSDQTQEVAGALADVVLAPLLFLGPALLYLDQAARADEDD
jgi:hypothetical protein